jgi:hypothetical protein
MKDILVLDQFQTAFYQIQALTYIRDME